MANDYGNDFVKEKSRLEIYKFANKHLPRERSKATAVYLASTNERESYWLDKLGIPRGNRVILEADVDKVETVRRANPGIRVLNTTTTEFFREEAKNPKYSPFWYCGLDYEEQLTQPVIGDLNIIRDSSLITEGGILYTNIVGQREKIRLKGEYLFRFLRVSDNDRSVQVLGPTFGKNFYNLFERSDLENEMRNIFQRHPQDFHGFYTEFQETVGRMLVDKIPSPRLDTLRSYAIHISVRDSLQNIDDPRLRDPMVIDFCIPKNCEIAAGIFADESYLLQFIKGYRGGEVQGASLNRLLRDIQNVIPFLLHRDTEFDRFINTFQNVLLFEDNTTEYYKSGGIEILLCLLSNLDRRGYTFQDFRPCVYTSSKNTRMVLDITSLRKIDPKARNIMQKLLDREVGLIYTLKRPYLVDLGVSWDSRHSLSTFKDRLSKLTHRYVQWLTEEVGYLEALYLDYTLTRLDLGSSFKPTFTPRLVERYIREGMSDEEILDKCHIGDNQDRIAAIRKKLTREANQENVQNQSPSKDVEKSKKYQPELPKRLVPEHVYRALPEGCKRRIDYFMDEVMKPLHHISQWHIKRAFAASELSDLLVPEINPIRVYAFFDDVAIVIRNRETIKSDYLTQHFKEIRDAEALTPIVSYPEKTRQLEKEDYQEDTQPIREPSSELTHEIKEIVRQMIREGASKENVWETCKDYFSSKKQFGAVIAWASPNLARKRKNQ